MYTVCLQFLVQSHPLGTCAVAAFRKGHLGNLCKKGGRKPANIVKHHPLEKGKCPREAPNTLLSLQ